MNFESSNSSGVPLAVEVKVGAVYQLTFCVDVPAALIVAISCSQSRKKN